MTRAAINRRKKLAAKPKAPDKSLAKSTPPKEKKPGWELAGMTPEQKEEAHAIRERVLNRPGRANVRLAGEDGVKVLVVGSGSDANKTLHSMRLFEALGTKSNGFIDDSLHRISSALRLTGHDDIDSNRVSAAVALVSAVEPQNELEATMAIQLVAANDAALMCFERSRTAQYMEHASAYSNMANKAMRSFALHVEAIAKLRRGGEQVVKHLHVYEGGQAVVAGTINQKRGGVSGGSDEQACGAGSVPASAALPSPDQARDGVPIPSDAQRPVPVTRGEESWSAEGEHERMEARSEIEASSAGPHNAA